MSDIPTPPRIKHNTLGLILRLRAMARNTEVHNEWEVNVIGQAADRRLEELAREVTELNLLFPTMGTTECDEQTRDKFFNP